jgi:para-aminobenzoate synthetase/4-amino-4-deoxychorismate lyase
MLLDMAEYGGPIWLCTPVRTYAAVTPADVIPLLRQAEREARDGFWVGGYLAYEAAAAFGLPTGRGLLPLAQFVVFAQAVPAIWPPVMPDVPRCYFSPRRPESAHAAAVRAIQEYLCAGDSYQVNFTLPCDLATGSGVPLADLAALFIRTQRLHQAPYAAWLHTGSVRVASFSPELLLDWRDRSRLVTAPIKGTAARVADPETDHRIGQALEASAKNRAEHVMIVDMARNDLGRICQTGTIRVPHLMERRQFSTLHHLESRVHGLTRPEVTLAEVFAALFPAASVTGAPKHRTMAIIHDLEAPEARGVYTGAVGVLRPGGDALFNVAIRTVVQHDGRCWMGLGGGIVADSEPGSEWQELLHKGQFLTRAAVTGTTEPFHLIETMRVELNGCIVAQTLHLERLAQSAQALGLACPSRSSLEQQLALYIADRIPESLRPRRLRLQLSGTGACLISDAALPEAPPHPLRVCAVAWVVDRQDRLLRHKTTWRHRLDHALHQAQQAGFDEILLGNNLGQVTEGAIRSLLVCLDGRWYVPPVEDGLLPGIWRQQAMEHHQARERSMTLDDLRQADAIWMGNAVRGGTPVGVLCTADGRQHCWSQPM